MAGWMRSGAPSPMILPPKPRREARRPARGRGAPARHEGPPPERGPRRADRGRAAPGAGGAPRRPAIADVLAPNPRGDRRPAAAAAAAANRDEHSALEARRQAAEAALEATAAAHKDEWAATLCRRALAGNEAGGEA